MLQLVNNQRQIRSLHVLLRRSVENWREETLQPTLPLETTLLSVCLEPMKDETLKSGELSIRMQWLK